MNKFKVLRYFYGSSIIYAVLGTIFQIFQPEKFKLEHRFLNNCLILSSLTLLIISMYLYHKNIRK